MLLALFGFFMALAYDPPVWVWLIGMLFVIIEKVKFIALELS